jgi:LmbE family N-acetylglucosaminyl deacetylase
MPGRLFGTPVVIMASESMNLLPILQSLLPGQTVLILAAHCDDAEIGCGGLLRRLAEAADPRCELRQIVFTGGDDPVRRQEQLVASEAFGVGQVSVKCYPETALPSRTLEIKDELLAVRDKIGSERIGMVLCPRLDDRHQDHQTVAENAWRVFRDHLILEYEIPKYEGDWASMNLFVRLSEAEAREKVERLLQCFPSRVCHRWWNRETFLGLMRVRGIEANAECAEAFVARKLVF